MAVAQGDLATALTSYQDSLAIEDRLAKADPSNAGRQRDLFVAYDKVGDVLVAQGNLAAAQKFFHDSLAIAERLTTADPSNAGWQRDLAVSHDRIAELLAEQGDAAQALSEYRQAARSSRGLRHYPPTTPPCPTTSPCWMSRSPSSSSRVPLRKKPHSRPKPDQRAQ